MNVNARPWGVVRIDGQEVGPTPLAGVPLAPGPHAFEVAFPDGRIVHRVAEVGPDTRFLAFE